MEFQARRHSSSFIPVLVLLLSAALSLLGTLNAFKLVARGSMTHNDITVAAILNITAQVCKALAQQEGRDFVLAEDSLSVHSLSEACLFTDSVKSYQTAIAVISSRNAWVDLRHVLDEEYHFDDESFVRGRRLITRGLVAAKANIKQGNYRSAQLAAGEIMHTLQDFYSHSNWIELGNMNAFPTLIRADLDFDNIADINMPTCRNCEGDNCDNNILESVLAEQKITSGYFSLTSSSKPNGKCSHGTDADRTSKTDPRGGINKDAVDAEHGSLHPQAAQVAITATSQLLQDIRGAAGDADFLRFLGISRSSTSSGVVLCFVIDTSAGTAGVLAELKTLASSIASSQSDGNNKPDIYIVVPFNETGYGPLKKTTNSDKFIFEINSLSASGAVRNSSEPRQSLSALLLALTEAPSSSEIFVFSSGPPGDIYLKSTLTALIENSKSVVNFLLTNLSSDVASADLYRSLARTSGGQAIEITEKEFSQAVTVVTDSLTSARATLLQVVRDQGAPETFDFTVDSSVRTLLVYVTGDSLTFNITTPTGVGQKSEESVGHLGTIQKVGNFHTVRLTSPVTTGQWHVGVNSSQPYTLKAIGESTIDFFFDFVEVFQFPEPGFTSLHSRPRAGGNASLSVSVTGGSSVKVTAVTLFRVSGGTDTVQGVLGEQTDTGDYLVALDRLPDGPFYLQVRGENSSTSKASDRVFQRQSSTQLRSSTVAITAQESGDWTPGTNFTVDFTVSSTSISTSTGSSGNTVTVRHTNNRGFAMAYPGSLALGSGGQAEDKGTLSAPSDTPSGTAVTLVIEADSSTRTSDSNYVVMDLTVTAEETDVTPPECQPVTVNASCSSSDDDNNSSNCTLLTWDFTAVVSDGLHGSGVDRVSVREANGTLNTTSLPGSGGFNVTMASFTTSCCVQEVVLVAVDGVGNVGICLVRSGGGAEHLQGRVWLTAWVSMMGVIVTKALYS
ncbi:von Willebrand factor A domain-containing protein 7-like [Engraulis encrasicolus]|uniref:von Willebrand factor A domain-containing protein 7-like n=1 Tax=Engraulis encrasicolus TaxID=184585 RepID=UPI002FD4E54F